MTKCFLFTIYSGQSISGQFPNQPGGFSQGAGNYGPGFDSSATMNSGIREHYSIPVMNGSGPVSKYSTSGQSNAVPQSSSSSSLSSADGMNGITTQSPFLPQSMSSNNESSQLSDVINGINNNNNDNNPIESLKRKTMDDDTSLHNLSNHNVTAEQ
jgi:hypothetical protein